MTRRQADKLIASGAEALVRLTNDPRQEEEFVITIISRRGAIIRTSNDAFFSLPTIKFLGPWKAKR
jgi:hypothetical protein